MSHYHLINSSAKAGRVGTGAMRSLEKGQTNKQKHNLHIDASKDTVRVSGAERF